VESSDVVLDVIIMLDFLDETLHLKKSREELSLEEEIFGKDIFLELQSGASKQQTSNFVATEEEEMTVCDMNLFVL
jgi:hypothetical protein